MSHHPVIVTDHHGERVSGHLSQVFTNSLGEPFSFVVNTARGPAEFVPIGTGVEVRFVSEVDLAREQHRSGG